MMDAGLAYGSVKGRDGTYRSLRMFKRGRGGAGGAVVAAAPPPPGGRKGRRSGGEEGGGGRWWTEPPAQPATALAVGGLMR